MLPFHSRSSLSKNRANGLVKYDADLFAGELFNAKGDNDASLTKVFSFKACKTFCESAIRV
jgi:hypothetical protein